MFRLLVAAAIAIAAWSAGVPAAAQEFDAEELALARQVQKASQTGRSFDELLPNVAERAKTTFIQSNPQMQLGIIEVVDKVALDLVPRRDDLDQKLSEVWALAFDKDELRALLDFYSSPAGKKFAAAMPRILALQVRYADAWSQEVSQEMYKRVGDELTAMAKAEAQRLQGGANDADATSGLKLKAQ